MAKFDTRKVSLILSCLRNFFPKSGNEESLNETSFYLSNDKYRNSCFPDLGKKFRRYDKMRDTFRGSNLAKECVHKLFRNPKQNFILYIHSHFSTYSAKLCLKGTKSQRYPVASRDFYGLKTLFYKNSRSYLFNAQFLKSLDPFLTILALHANFMR